MSRRYDSYFLTLPERQNGVDGVRDYVFFPNATPPRIERAEWHPFSAYPSILHISGISVIDWAKLSANSNVGSFSAPVITQYDSLGDVLDLESIGFEVQCRQYYEKVTGVTALFSKFIDDYGLSGYYEFYVKDYYGFKYYVTLDLDETDTSKQKATVKLVTGGHLVDSSYISNDMEASGSYYDNHYNRYVVMDVIPTPDNASDATAVRTIVYRGVYTLALK